MTKKLILPIFLVLSVFSAVFVIRTINSKNANISVKTPALVKSEVKSNDDEINLSKAKFEVVATNLTVPWEIVFLPSGDMLVTQRSGELLRIGDQTKIIQKIQGVNHVGEGGLLGMALSRNFSEDGLLFLYLTSSENGNITNRVERYRLENDKLVEKKILLQGIKGATNHDGGRIAIGQDGYLYIATGDAENQQSSQDKGSLNGKILRITTDGDIPSNNPFGTAIYSLGHRNPQGLAWDIKGNLWASEHGPSGLASGFDEINLINAGSNYGWPLVTGDDSSEGLVSPVIHSGSSDTWAPSGMAYSDGSLYFSGLRGEALYQAKIAQDGSLSLTEHFKGQFGRIRAVVIGPDGNLYFSTSNTDGRGNPDEDDDKIIKVILTQ